MRFFFLFLFLNFVSSSFACLHTFQYKIFPVGVQENQIVTVDFQINRTSVSEGNRAYRLSFKKTDDMQVMWVLKSHVSIYNKKGKLLTSTTLDTVFVAGKKYEKEINKSYQKAFDKIVEQYKNIELFMPKYISFCDYQKNCSLLQVHYDSIQNKDFLTYENKKYELDLLQDTVHYNMNKAMDEKVNSKGLAISSVRVYETKTTKIVMAHLERGHQLSMGWITSDPNRKPKDEFDVVILAKEHQPDFEFKEIRKTAYQEPLLHHGFGIDLFIVE